MVRLILPLLVLALAAAASPDRPEKPVMVGGIADLDACLSNGQVTGLNPRGDGFLSVRSRPAATARELGRLRSGQIVWAQPAMILSQRLDTQPELHGPR